MMPRLVVLLLGCCLAAVGSMAAEQIETQDQIWEFMKKYGYIMEDDMVNGMPKDEETKTKSIIYFQKMGNMTMTGTLDEESMELMNTPRCGMTDMESDADMVRRKRYALGPRWTKTDLTWNVLQDSDDLSRADVERIMERAFKAWSDVSTLTFRKVTTNEPDIKIIFAANEHGDGFNARFDGSGGVLAHAYFPTSNLIGGDAHFDEDETYTDGTSSGINLFQVAAHEFGHSLGLRHSDVQDALMYPYYRGYVANFQLHRDDIAGIQAQYGEGNGQPEEPDTPSTPLDNCMPQISWATRTRDGSAYFANETHVFRRASNNMIPAGYPKMIGDEFPGLPTDLDAAFYYSPYTYFFKGSQYWRFRNRAMAGTYPRPLSDWQGLPNDLDSAYVWTRNGGIYFTKGNQYYRYNRGVSSYYPQPLSRWGGLPSDGVDAAFRYNNGYTYFFKGSEYYRFNDRNINVASGYPRNTAIQWLGCDPNELFLGPTADTGGDATADTGGDATVMVPSMVAVFFSALSALYYAF
ncbi:matrix metalloproteinase-14 [Strongylocentrotus purpuratus]|uniref:Peptidase metallopeptidase domain-containing protein n=1 Tax=Strongylocentrotus purpuratus TaxID=7668 RepID=A0A7M7NHH9_STRPU|nr:matrix metalloproteinase-14 [Strongylocentrotus purpuratus]